MSIQIAMVGCGGMAEGHAQTFKKISDVTLAAFVDPVRANRERFRDRHNPAARLYETPDQLLSDPPAGLDGVVLVTPHTQHFEQATAALRAGLHVLVEKPMVTRSADAYALWRTVNETARHLVVATQAPFTAEYQYIKSLRESGELGTVQIIQGWLAQQWLAPTAGSWRQDPALSGGGQMYDSGAHVLNGMMWLMNEPVVEVACMYDTCGTRVDINGVAIMKFQSGAMGSVAIGGNSPGWNVSLNLQTDRMQVRTGPHGGFIEVTGSPAHRYPQVPTAAHPAEFTAQMNFVRCIRGEASPIAPVRSGVLLSALMDALYESAAAGRPVKVKPVPAEL
jgi:predicted dehydrogenase